MKIRAFLAFNIFALVVGTTWFAPSSRARDLNVRENRFATPTPQPQGPIGPAQVPNPNVRTQFPGKLVLHVPIPVTKAAPRPPLYGKQSDRRLKGTRNKLRSVPPPMHSVLSIKEVKQLSDPASNMVNVLVENVGNAKNRPGEESRMLIGLGVETSVYRPDNGFANSNDVVGTELNPLYVWVAGKPAPHPASGFWGFGTGTDDSELTQKMIDALPATTNIPRAFHKYVTIPPIEPGKSVWVSSDFTLPDPGTTAIPSCRFLHPPYCEEGTTGIREDYIDAAEVAQRACDNLKFFYGSWLRLEIQTPAGAADIPGQNDLYWEQLNSAFFMHDSEIPQGKYKGKCMG